MTSLYSKFDPLYAKHSEKFQPPPQGQRGGVTCLLPPPFYASGHIIWELARGKKLCLIKSAEYMDLTTYLGVWIISANFQYDWNQSIVKLLDLTGKITKSFLSTA